MTYQHMDEIDFSVYPIYNDAIDYHELCVNALTMYLNEIHEELNEE